MRIRFERKTTLKTVALAALLVFAPIATATAQNDANARLQRIEREIQTLSRAIFKGETPPQGAFSGGADAAGMGGIQTRLDQMEMDLRTLTGRVEEQSYELNRLRLIEERLNALESRGAVPAVQQIQPQIQQQVPQQPTYPPEAAPYMPAEGGGFTMQGDPNAAATNAPSTGQLGQMSSSGATDPVTVSYEAAYAMLRNQDYGGAQVAFEQFVQAHPDHSLTPNAMYWLGETHYVRNDFQRAAYVFAEAYQKYPKGAKAPDNLLKLALSLAGQGKTQDACVALGQLKKEYPAGAAPVLTRGDQEMARLGCQ